MDTQERLNRINNGQDSALYEFLGCHLGTKDNVQGAWFRAYSPNAKEIFVFKKFLDFMNKIMQKKDIQISCCVD